MIVHFVAGYYIEDDTRDYKIDMYNDRNEMIDDHTVTYDVKPEILHLPYGAMIDCYRVEVEIRWTALSYLPSYMIPRQICFSRVGDNLLAVHNLNLTTINNMENMFRGCSNFLGFYWSEAEDLGIPFSNANEVKSTSYMFEGCRALTHLDLSMLDTSKVKYMSGMFKDCSSLEELLLYGWDTSNVKDMSAMFEGCELIEDLPIDIFNMTSVQNTDCMFKNCTSLRILIFNNHKELVYKEYYPYRNLEYTNEMFYNCTSLEELEIPYFCMSNVRVFDGGEYTSEMRDMFYECRSLHRINLANFEIKPETFTQLTIKSFFEILRKEAPNLEYIQIPSFNSRLDYYTVTDMSSLFENLTELIEVDLGGWNTQSVTDMSRMFKGCAKLENVNINGWDFSNVIYADSMFEDCNSMSSITHQDKPLFKKIASANQMFKHCTNLMELRFNEGCIFEFLAAANEMFYGCENMYSLEIPNFDVRRIGTSFGKGKLETNMRDIFKYCFSLETIKLNNFKIDNEVSQPSDIEVSTETEFGDYRFEYFFDTLRNGAPNLKHIEMRDFNNPPLTSMKGMFKDFTNVETIDLAKSSTENITDMSEMFHNCYKLNELDLSSFNTSNVTTMALMFMCCRELVRLDLSSFDTRAVTLMTGMFEHTESLSQCVIEQFDYKNVLTLGHLFYNSGIKEIPPSNYRSANNVRDVSYMFALCKNLTNASNIRDLNTDAVEQMDAMFRGCESLDYIDLSNFTARKVRHMSYMFCDCKKLHALDLSRFDAGNVETFESMFEGCESIVELDLSNFTPRANITYRRMFKDCKNLERVDISGMMGRAENSNAADHMFEGCEKLSYIDMSNFRYDDGNFNDGMDVFTNVGINTSDGVLNVGMLYIDRPITCRDYAEKLTKEVHKNVKRINIYVQEANADECMDGFEDIYDRVRFIKYIRDELVRIDLELPPHLSTLTGCSMYWDSDAREYYIYTGYNPNIQNPGHYATGIREKIKIPIFTTMIYLDFNPKKDEYVKRVDYVKVQIPMKEKIEEESDK